MTTADQAPSTTLLPPWVHLAQAAWVVIAILTIVLFASSSINAFRQPLPSCAAGDGTLACYPYVVSLEDMRIASTMGWSGPFVFNVVFAASILARLGLFGMGIFIFWRKRDDWLAMMMSAMLIIALLEGVASSPGEESSVVQVLYAVAILIFVPLWFVFPNGRHEPRWTRWISLPLAIGVLICYYLAKWLNWLYVSLLFVSLILAIYAMIYRYRRAAGTPEREQIRWVAIGVGILLVGIIFNNGGGMIYPASQPSSQRLGFLLANALLYAAWYWSFAFCIGIAILRYRLWGIDVVFNRALVYAVLSAFVIVAYVVIVGGLGALFQAGGNFMISLIATGLIAVSFQPVRDKLQSAINRLMYGQRDDPYSVLSSFSQNLEATLDSNAVLPTIVETVAKTLKFPYVAVWLGDSPAATVAAAFGTPSEHPFILPLNFQQQRIGELHVAPRSPGEPFAPAERRLLADIARQTGVAAYNVCLTSELQRSRERLVNTREEERRRLRRDLHDGLGPKLAGQSLILEALLDSQEVGSQNRELVEHLIKDSQLVVSEIRGLVQGLRPPALDELGLIGALRALAVQCESGKLHVTVDVPTSIPPLPAAVEVAAYRITQEALTNVVKHAQARTSTVLLSVDRFLDLMITDDGVGLQPDRRTGVGLASMRERAEEIGGTCTASAMANGGTQVVAQLPIRYSLAE